MNKNIYFAGSIRGGQNDTALYHEIIDYINQTDHVLTEQVGNVKRSVKERGRKLDAEIYQQDMHWLENCDFVIAECTHPSLGVGYEMAYAEKCKKPVYIFYRSEETNLSAMLTGNPYFHIETYQTKEELFQKLDCILKDR